MSFGAYRQPGLASAPVEIDPSAPGTVMRVALGLESLLNVPFAGAMIFAPNYFLRTLATTPAAITPTAEVCARFYGLTMIGMTAPMVMGVFNNRGAIESRPYTYLMLAGAEATMIGWAVYIIYGPGGRSGFSVEAMKSFIQQIAPALLWRLFVFFKKPEWFGRYREVKGL